MARIFGLGQGMVFLKGNISLKDSLVNPAYSGTNKSLSQTPRTHYFCPVKIPLISLGSSFQLGWSP
jgi:hypothetical protein